jgi:hypothetical protein
MTDAIENSPFDDPGLLTGYPLDEHDRDELDRAIERLEHTPAEPASDPGAPAEPREPVAY